MFDELFGLPAHPLLIHAPVVLVPIVAIAAIVLAAKSSWRRRAGWAPTVVMVVIVAMLFAARESGQALDDQLGGVVGLHETLGNQTFLISAVWLVVVVALGVVDRRATPAPETTAVSAAQVSGGADAASIVLAVASAVVGVVATIWLIRTGHTGADSHWSLYVA
jgi:hypothetical protein